jgi:hypothetical protein
LGIPARGGIGHLVATKATAHARELVTRGELELIDRAMALRATDVSIRVGLVAELKVCAWELQLGHRVSVTLLVTEVAKCALSRFVVARLDVRDVGVVRRVARVAYGAGGHQHVGCCRASVGCRMACLARRADRFAHVPRVVESQRDSLCGKNGAVRSRVRIERARGQEFQRHLLVRRQRGKSVDNVGRFCKRWGREQKSGKDGQ